LKQSIAAKGLAEFEACAAAPAHPPRREERDPHGRVRGDQPGGQRAELHLTYDREHSAILLALKERDPESPSAR
jgi:hypothetical protein